jgi:hypothetical protein
MNKIILLFTSLAIFGNCPQVMAQQLSPLGSIATNSEPKSLQAYFNSIFVAEGEYGVELFDFSNPTSPQLITRYDTPGRAEDIFYYHPELYIADGDSGVLIINVENPLEPRILSNIQVGGYANSITVSCGIIYIAVQDQGIESYMVLDPANPVYLTSAASYGSSKMVFGPCGSIFLADGESGVQFYANDGPDSLINIGGFNTDGSAVSVWARSDYAYVADSTNGLIILGVDDPADMQLISDLTADGAVVDVIERYDRIFFADTEGYILVYDVESHYYPVFIDQVRLNGPAVGLGFWDFSVFAIDRNRLYMYEMLLTSADEKPAIIPERPDLTFNYPNPFNSSTIVSFKATEPGDAVFSVYDVNGRLIYSDIRANLRSGLNSFNWNADDLPSGTYLYSIQSGNITYRNKMTFLK